MYTVHLYSAITAAYAASAALSSQTERANSLNFRPARGHGLSPGATQPYIAHMCRCNNNKSKISGRQLADSLYCRVLRFIYENAMYILFSFA